MIDIILDFLSWLGFGVVVALAIIGAVKMIRFFNSDEWIRS